MIGFNRPFSELAARLGEEVRAAAGPIQLVYRIASPAPAGHWLNDPLQGGGRILGEACHMFDFANWLCGTPERVFAAAPPAPRGAASTESATTTIQYADGSVATVHYSGVGSTSMPKERIEVMRGDRSWILDDFSTLTTYGPDGERTERARGRQGPCRTARACARGGPRRGALRAGSRRRVPRAERRTGRARFDRVGRVGGRPGAAGQERLMCGICGILATRDGFAVGEELVTTMRETIVHRGPDDGGSWYSPEHRVALAHRRLSIVDLSPAGHQPMTNEDGTVWITFNGEIYNHMELRPELEAKGHRYRSRTDTETIIHLYEEEGPALRRAARRDVRLRDLGLTDARAVPRARPPREEAALLRADRRAGFVFGSEIKALLEHPAIRPELDEEAFFHYLTFVCTPAPLTMFKGIRKLAPAERMIVRADGSTTSTTYWSPMSDEAAREVAAATEPELEERLLQLLRDSIGRRMMSDVPFGVFLSGGVDSSTNVALMSELMTDPVRTFSVGFGPEYERYNELEHARKIAQLFGTDHHEVVIDVADLEAFLPELIYHQDEPIADWVASRSTTSRSSRATTGRSSSRSARARTSSSTATRATSATRSSPRATGRRSSACRP